MFIHEAVKEAMEKGKSVRRKVWWNCGWEDERFKLKPDKESAPMKTFAMGGPWIATPEELIADDWEVVE